MSAKVGYEPINVTQKMKFVLGRVENIAKEGENLVANIFFFSHNVFKSLISTYTARSTIIYFSSKNLSRSIGMNDLECSLTF